MRKIIGFRNVVDTASEEAWVKTGMGVKIDE
jgi:hypothetical protein